MAISNFETFVLFNPVSKNFSLVNSTKLAGINMTIGGAVAMLFKDLGVNGFPANQDFAHKVDFEYVSAGSWPAPYVLSVEDTLDASVTRPLTMSESDASATDDSLGVLCQSAAMYLNSVVNGARSFSVGVPITVGSTYYLTISYNATAKTVTLNIYSDSARTVLIGSKTLSHNVSKAKRYMQIGDYQTTTASWSANFSNLDIGETPQPSVTVLNYERGHRGISHGVMRGV